LSGYDQGIGFATKIKKLFYRSLMNTCLEIAWLIRRLAIRRLHFRQQHDLQWLIDWLNIGAYLDVISMTFLFTNPDGVHLFAKNQGTLEGDKGLVKLKYIFPYRSSCLRCSS
jgi:hypothetical protein